jgi:hypothetical protein
VLEREEAPGASHAGLHFVGQQQRAVLVREGTQGRKKAGRSGQYPALTLHGLDDDGRHVRPHGAPHRGDIAVRHVGDARQRAKPVSVLGLAGQRERAERAPVEGVFERDHTQALGLPQHEEVAARQLEQGFDRLRAGVAEKDAVHAGRGAQPRGEPHVGVIVEIVRDVAELTDLLAQRGDELGMRVAQRAHGDARIHVEVTLARAIPDVAALAARQDERRLAVIRVERLLRRGEHFRNT